MRYKILFCLGLFLFANGAHAATTANGLSEVDITKIIEAYAKSSNKKIVVDPRVKGKVRIVGLSLEQVTFDELSTVLHAHAFASYRSGEMLVILPSNIIKSQSVPMVEPNKSYVPNEYVSDLISFGNVCVYTLPGLLRPQLSVTSHFYPDVDSRKLFIIDTYANTLKMRTIINEIQLDKKSVKKCAPPD